MAVPTTNIRITAVNTEITSVNSNSLTTLSQNANEYTGYTLLNNAPYGLNEFAGYNHGPSQHTVTWTRNGPVGKISQYYTSNETGTAVPFGSNNWAGWTYGSGTSRFTINWSGARNDSWTSFLIGSSTFNRTGASSTTSLSHVFQGLSSTQNSNILNNTTGYFVYGP